MSYNGGTSTDYLDLLDQVCDVLKSQNLDAVAVNGAGSGYVVDDVLDIDGAGSTGTQDAQIEVTAVDGGGAITTARIYRSGAYTVPPTTTTGNSASGGTGSGASFDLTFAAASWTELARNREAVSATVAAGGTGYNTSDVLTLVGGVVAFGGAPATFTATASGGAVTSAALLTAGDYEIFPSDPVLTTVAPAGGTGCTLNVVSQVTTGDRIVILRGSSGGTGADPIVGIKTYSNELDESGGNTVFNWALFAMTSWSDILPLHQQANITPGFSVANDGSLTTSASGDGAFVPLKDADAFPIDWRVAHTGRYVHVTAKVETATTDYDSACSFGLQNPPQTFVELPFPGYVSAPSDRKRVWYGDTGSIWGGLTEVISRNNGPMFVWDQVAGQWLEAKNATISSNISTTPGYAAQNVAPRVLVTPIGASNIQATPDDQIWGIPPSTGFDNEDITLSSNPIEIYRTPQAVGDPTHPMYRATVVQADNASGFFRSFGEIPGVAWFHLADSATQRGDRLEDQNGERWEVFMNGTRNQPWSFFAIQEG